MSNDKLQKTLDNLLNKLVKPKYKDVNDILVKVYNLSSGPLPHITIVTRNVRIIRDSADLENSIIRILKYLNIPNYNITYKFEFDE
jgi:hypothetical protein